MMINTRRATAEDREFLWNLKVASMREHIEKVHGWDTSFQENMFVQRFDPDSTWIIQADGCDIGMYACTAGEAAVSLNRIEIMPEFQNRGIGTEIIRRIIARADTDHKSVRLQVFKANRAARLYERLGFARIGETETHLQMELQNDSLDTDAALPHR